MSDTLSLSTATDVPEGEDQAVRSAGLPPEAAVEEAAASASQAREALARVLEAEELRASPQLSTILRFVVEATLDGRREAIKGYTIAVEALGRDPSFDPQIDPIVRVEATRLRRALQRYYAGAGANDDIEIVIPRGSYVPLFVPRRGGAPAVGVPGAEAGEAPAPGVVPGGSPDAQPAPGLPPAAPSRAGGTRPWRWVGGLVLLLVLAVAIMMAVDVVETSSLRALFPGFALRPIERSNRLGIPMVEVRAFDITGSPPLTAAAAVPGVPAASTARPPGGEFPARALEMRIRDALARFDLLDVLASPDARPRLDCGVGGASPHSAFALGGLVESHEDGAISLLMRLSDLCDGTIVWSRDFDALRPSEDPIAVENELVREIMASLAEPYGVIQARARARVMSSGGSGKAGPYGCVLLAYDYWRSYLPADHAAARSCLEKAVAADGTFALGYALLAELYLDEIRNGANPRPSPPALNRALASAEQAIELSPTSGFFRRVALDVHSYRGERGAALAQGDIALQLNPYDVDTLADYGGRLITFGELDRGEAMLASALKAAPAMPPAVDYFRVLAAYLRGDAAGAAAAADRLMGEVYAPGLLARALATHLAGDEPTARADIDRLVALVPAWKTDTATLLARFFPAPHVARKVGADLATLGLGTPAPGTPTP
ncbi:tetratricopeptide (TPR) repeat protein [Ancylobacter sp. 3268]|uniref:tetratricopeptide repeat protein n=1 Tax=Ancylobacter sp. 3268 TaxID=2817752 RepID=UPI0028648AB0|nr:hypothetical protein [Ancylobacter sp. 3268]MDR6954538.1 tetratricopeptide (TPR) repeat protein [Ancylobacter sp. 3268]